MRARQPIWVSKWGDSFFEGGFRTVVGSAKMVA